MSGATAAEARSEDVRIYAAASLTAAVTELAEAYAASSDGVAILVTGSSGALANQILQGAPADLFLSANRAWIDFLVENQAVDPDAIAVFAGNRLVLIAPSGSDLADGVAPDALEEALRGRRIVIADPEVAPVGAYARQALTALGLWAAATPGLVQAADAAAALSFVARDAVDLGVVYRSDAAQADVVVVFTFPEESHDPVRYFAAPVDGGDTQAAQAFLDLLLSEDGGALLGDLGFDPPPPDRAPEAQ